MLNVMRIDKALVVAARKRTALVPGNKGAFYRRWHRAGLATDIQRLPVLVFADNHRVSITAESFDAFDLILCFERLLPSK